MFKEINAWDESWAIGRDKWNRLAKCAVRCVSDWRWEGSEGSDGCEYCELPPPKALRAMITVAYSYSTSPRDQAPSIF